MGKGGGGGTTTQSMEIPEELKELYAKTGARMLALQDALPMVGASEWFKANQGLYNQNPHGLWQARPGTDPMTGKPAELPPHMAAMMKKDHLANRQARTPVPKAESSGD